jgi:hypothetical protein
VDVQLENLEAERKCLSVHASFSDRIKSMHVHQYRRSLISYQSLMKVATLKWMQLDGVKITVCIPSPKPSSVRASDVESYQSVKGPS